MALVELILKVTGIGAALVAFVFALYKCVGLARARSTGGFLLGSLLFFGFGDVRDPTLDNIHESRKLKGQEEDDSGDPPNPDSD